MAAFSAGRPKASQPIGLSAARALHPQVAIERVAEDVVAPVADVEVARRIREHVQHVELVAGRGDVDLRRRAPRPSAAATSLRSLWASRGSWAAKYKCCDNRAMVFNPFSVDPAARLDEQQLQRLVENSVAEGYNVEYKRQPPEAKKIAHGIASFANSLGGWYIIGVVTDGHNVARAVSGFDPAQCHDPIGTVREAAKQISPVPIFFPQVVTLASGKLVCVVFVPDNQETPFITKDGVIYRRTFDSSNPVAENDRHAIDRLVDRGKTGAHYFKRFARDDRTFSEAESNVAWLRVFLTPLPHGIIDRQLRDIDVLRQAQRLWNEQVSIPFNIPDMHITGGTRFDAARTTSNSIILRQVVPSSDWLHSNVSVELNTLGGGKLLLPIPMKRFEVLCAEMTSQGIRDMVRQRMQSRVVPGMLEAFDLGETCLALAILINHYQRWLGRGDLVSEFACAIELHNVWRVVPLFDDDTWVEYVKEFGLPIMATKSARTPLSDGSFGSATNENMTWTLLCGHVALMFGFRPRSTASASEEQLLVPTSARSRHRRPHERHRPVVLQTDDHHFAEAPGLHRDAGRGELSRRTPRTAPAHAPAPRRCRSSAGGRWRDRAGQRELRDGQDGAADVCARRGSSFPALVGERRAARGSFAPRRASPPRRRLFPRRPERASRSRSRRRLRRRQPPTRGARAGSRIS